MVPKSKFLSPSPVASNISDHHLEKTTKKGEEKAAMLLSYDNEGDLFYSTIKLLARWRRLNFALSTTVIKNTRVEPANRGYCRGSVSSACIPGQLNRQHVRESSP